MIHNPPCEKLFSQKVYTRDYESNVRKLIFTEAKIGESFHKMSSKDQKVHLSKKTPIRAQTNFSWFA